MNSLRHYNLSIGRNNFKNLLKESCSISPKLSKLILNSKYNNDSIDKRVSCLRKFMFLLYFLRFHFVPD